MMKKKLWIFAGIVGLALMVAMPVKAAPTADEIKESRPAVDKYCFDYTGTLSADAVAEINFEGRSLKRAFDIDFLIVMIPSLEGNELLDYTVDLFSNWEIGKGT